MKIAIAILSYRAIPVTTIPRILIAESYCRRRGISTEMWMYGHALVHQARNAALFEIDGADYTVFIDDDMSIESDHIYKLVTQQAQVISGICTTRNHPVQLAAKVWDEEMAEFVQMDFISRKVTGKVCTGAAFMAIRKDAREKLLERHLKAQDWLEDNRRMFDRMHVRAERRESERARIEAARRIIWEKNKTARIFDHPVGDSELQMGEDIGFGLRCMQAGIDITIDPMIAPLHVGEYGYSIADYEPEGGWRQQKAPSVLAGEPTPQELFGNLIATARS